MKPFPFCITLAVILTIGLSMNSRAQESDSSPTPGYIIQLDHAVAQAQSGPHDGGGATTGYSFFSQVQDMDFVFRKRALHPGSSIGYHEQDRDEIYYVISGKGELTMNGIKSVVSPGTALLTRPGTAHGLRQIGEDDLVIFIIYGKNP